MGNATTSSIKVQQNREQDLTGKRFGKLTVLEYDREKKNGKVFQNHAPPLRQIPVFVVLS